MDDRPSNVISMGRIELLVDPRFGDLWTGPAPVVRGTRFPPIQEIRLEVSCSDAKGRVWKSSNAYLISADGIFDTSLTAAVGDGYYGIAGEGPFYSMACEDGPGHDFAHSGLDRLHYRFACFDGSEEIWSKELTRFRGRLDKDELPEPWVKLLYFDDEVTSDEFEASAALASYGIKVAGSHLGSQFGGMLSEREEKELPTFIVASGRSSGKALELAIRSDDVRGVVLFSGGGLRFDPIDGGHYDEVSQQWIEEPLEHLTLDHSSLRPKAEGIVCTRTLYAEAVADRAARDRGRIKVEHVGCPIYMFSGLDDQVWPSSAFSELIAQRRKMKGVTFATVHRTFEGVGHDIGPSLGLPTLPTTERTIGHPDTGFRLLLGGKMGRTARARRECWDTLLQILSGQPPTV